MKQVQDDGVTATDATLRLAQLGDEWVALRSRLDVVRNDYYRLLTHIVAGMVRRLVARFWLQAADAEDAVQEVLVELVRVVEQSGPNGPCDVESSLRFAYQMLVNWAKRRHRDRHQTGAEPNLASLAASEDTAETDIEELQRFMDAVSRLQFVDRILIRLRFTGHTCSELAAMFGEKPATVRKAFSRAMTRLLALLKS